MPRARAYCARKPDHPGAHLAGEPCAGGCGTIVSRYGSASGYCRTCYASGSCGRCGRALYLRNKMGLCKYCAARVGERIHRIGVNQIKLAAGCADCGFRAHPDALVFSHVRGENRQQVASLYNCAWTRVLAEIAKCDVTCANCHAIRWTRQQREKFRDHQHAKGSAGYLAQRAVVAQAKLDAGCADCGYRECAEALQFDHVNGEKIAGIGRMTGSSREDLDRELAKCAVRCANCHAIRTAGLAGWGREAASDWQGISDATRGWALGKAREVGVTDERAVAAAVISALRTA
jgi:hypothetical protein